jgi:hypothetical protein
MPPANSSSTVHVNTSQLGRGPGRPARVRAAPNLSLEGLLMRLKKKKSIHPGSNVGGPSPLDDSLPVQKHVRDETIRAASRGRTEPRSGATPPKHHGSGKRK